jgi:hypothetical protein
MKKVVLGIAILILASGCVYRMTGTLERLHLQMTKTEVKEAIGNPVSFRGSILNKYGQTIEVWEYRFAKPLSSGPVIAAKPTDYWLYFCDDRLIQWGEAGDWRREADRIYEIRFR